MVSPKTQKIFVAVVVLTLLGFLGYQLLVQSPAVPESTGAMSNTEIAGQDILTLVAQLKKISIDQTFFTSPLFKNLKDLTQNVFPEAQGRPNPFAAIGSDSSTSITLSNSTQATSTLGR